MSLDDLIPDKAKESRSQETNSTQMEIKLRDDMKNISPMSCISCGEGTMFPVIGLTRIGSLMRCYRIFCDKGVMKHKRDLPESELAEVRDEMELIDRRSTL